MEQPNLIASAKKPNQILWILWTVLLIGILILGAVFRYTGMDWDKGLGLHPDERFMSFVLTSIRPEPLSEYFDTANSKLNPNNVGYSFYVYGTLPLFMARYVGDILSQTGFDEIKMVGRYLSASLDLMTVFLVFLIAQRLFRKPLLSLLAAAFSAFSVLPIQLSHFNTVDTYANFFIYLAIYFAVVALTDDQRIRRLAWVVNIAADPNDPQPQWQQSMGKWLRVTLSMCAPYVLFGVAFGMAMASKVSAAPVALWLAGAVGVIFSRFTSAQRKQVWAPLLGLLVLGAVISVVSFRIFQPYAFTGPGFFGIGLNERWLQGIGDIGNQQSGNVDFPPALQWARRPITFSLTNMVVWGLGLPLGTLAWGGFLWMGWKILRGEWRKYILLWGFTGLYFAWQAINFTRSMRYQLPVYPALAIIAAWAVFALWEKRVDVQTWLGRLHWNKALAGILGVGVLAGTFLWAAAFLQVYIRPVTRLAASQWIYQNVPATINLRLETTDGNYNYPLGYRQGAMATIETPIVMAFTPRVSGELRGIEFAHVKNTQAERDPSALFVSVSRNPDGSDPFAIGMVVENFNDTSGNDERGRSFNVLLAEPAEGDPLPMMAAGQTYYFTIQNGGPAEALNFAGPIIVTIRDGSKITYQPMAEPVYTIRHNFPYIQKFSGKKDGLLTEIYIPHLVDWTGNGEVKTLRLTFSQDLPGSSPLGVVEIEGTFLPVDDPRGMGYTFKFDQPIEVKEREFYSIELELSRGFGAIAAYGSRHALESTWDDPLPYGIEGFSPFDYNNGLYRSDLNFEMYWDDNEDKLKRFLTTLDQADYIFLSSNRQWGTTVRVPERYPLTTTYYRNLLGCPPDKDVFWCYAVAEPGMFQGKLGFELVYVNQSDPSLGNLRFNSQFAEEAFTVYDAPKVMIFRKSADYDPEQVASILKAVDLTKVKHLTPYEATHYKGFLLLPEDRLAQQRQGGTWSELFPQDLFYNQAPFLGMIVWYLTITLIGWAVYPFTRMALCGLRDKGYAFSRLVGILLLTFLVWFTGSAGVPVTRLTILVFLLVLIVINAFLFHRQRKIIQEEFNRNRKYYLMVEGIFLALFLFFLLVRVGNPDLWHPSKGGEKPMDFSYFNAVLKSTTFPPYDPWFADGYLNYYYYGFVLAAVPTKLLGITPAIAYNLILPTFFAFVGIGAFSVVWNLLDNRKRVDTEDEGEPLHKRRLPLLGGVAGVFGVLILGNWGTIRMIWYAIQRMAAPGSIEGVDIFTRIGWTFQGLINWFTGSGNFYIGQDEWYWTPSRAVPGNTITEFPYFTFLYGDPHAHMFALPLTILVIAVAVSVLKSKWKWGDGTGFPLLVYGGATFLMGGLVIGALRTTNTWDLPTYLALAGLVFGYTAYRYANLEFFNSWRDISAQLVFSLLMGIIVFLGLQLISMEGGIIGIALGVGVALIVFIITSQVGVSARTLIRWIYTGGVVAALAILSFLLYQPYAQWYAQAYNTIEPWHERTPFWSYMTHWGVFLFVIVSWMFWETRNWLAATPLSGLNRIRRNIVWVYLLLVAVLAAMIIFAVAEVEIAWLVIVLGLWAVALILRPGQSDMKRLTLFMVGTALALTLFVDVLRLEGDIGRMNTIFKFYLQAWILFGISAGAALIWLYPSIEKVWQEAWRKGWKVMFWILIAGAALYPLTATIAKVTDRMSGLAPATLDGMEYMRWSYYSDHDVDMELSYDYRAIRWMQDNIQGSPVIMEAYDGEYHWGARYAIYTGLPSVIGWRWHQSQQRVEFDSWVWDRMRELEDTWNSNNRASVQAFLQKYDVSYIIVGQLERAKYPAGMAKFDEWNGEMWNEVYRDGNTVIYQVVKQ